MTQQELEQSKKAVKTETAKAVASQKQARDYLVKMQVITKSGNLREAYK